MSDTPTIREMHGLSDKPRTFDQVAITVADPDTIRSWSFGEVVNPETINYRTFKPEKGGLFCERIFGPTRDMECACGKYKRIKHKGITCDRCGVEVTNARVRRERMGHIELAVPVSHIWFYKCMPSRIGLMLDMTARHLERVIYYEDYIVVDPGSTPLEKGAILTEEEFRNAEDEYGYDSFEAGMGAEAIQKMLASIDLATLVTDLQEQLDNTNSKQNKRKIAKRLKLAQGFLQSNTRPEWMILNVLPVIPPDLRPLVPLEGGRFATSDLNDLYRRVINRNNRLKTLLSLKTPEVIIRNEKRMLQEAVDALFDNGRHGRAVTGAGNRPLKSLSDMLKGKGGRFRQNLLGKRVDYSGRSVIVIGPELKLNQCGLPKKMALILFEPFIIHRLKELGYVHTVRSAKKLIDRKTPEVWDILEEVTKGHPVMLNRAPTLHRLSIQAFEPVLIEGSAIRLHPLVCNAYNADFDGDQMAVHVPLSVEAQMEARQLMLAPNNIFSPASGKPIATPTQDIILGAYFLTHTRAAEVQNNQDNHHHLPLFESIDEVEYAIAARKIGYHDWIRLHNPDYGKKPSEVVYGDVTKKVIVTTAGRVRFNEIWPRELGYINRNVGKKQMGDIIWRCYQTVGKERTVQTLDALKNLGFKEATRSGCSIGIVDMVVPSQKKTEIEKAYAELDKVTRQYKNGIITDGERYQKVVDIWTQTTDVIQAALYRKLEHNEGSKMASPLFMMVDSGARGNKAQIKQLSGMRGLMAKPSGEIIERPITANFREGLSVLEYFISTHGARKGLADTALKTADSGYMTRKLVDVAQDVIVHAEDCGTSNGITVHAIYDGDEEVASLASRIYGRTSCERIVDPVSGEVIVDINDLINEKQAEQLEKIGIERLKIRSVLTCELKKGCCAKCYGLNLATGQEVKIGEAVGIIAAQSIGEPGTQLTMRTFHVGGTATTAFKQPIVKAKNDGRVIYTEDLRTVENADGNFVVLNKNCSVRIENEQGRELESYQPVIGTILYVPNGGAIKKDETLATWDPYNVPVIAEKGGIVEFKDMIVGITVSKETDRETGASSLVVMEHKQELHPQVVIRDAKTREVLAHHAIPAGANLTVKDGETISAGTMVAKTPRKVAKTKDITGGLPRVAELFEARKPKDACTIARVEGIVRLSSKNTSRGKKVITIETPTGELVDHLVPMNKHVIVHEDDHVHLGDQLTEGPVSPEEILDVCGKERLQEHLVNEVQEVYRLQGVEINDKHVEIIVRQMLRKVVITEPGNTEFLWGDQVDKTTFDRINEQTVAQGGQPAAAKPVLLGITKASLETESFISAASFQDTTRVLTEASTLGKTDTLEGFKENVIMGHLIPAGTGFSRYSKIEVEPAEGAEEIASASEEEEAAELAENMLNDTINFDNER
ncbi:DNA-directed RNA polymerase subunit beta' [Akkermansia massiliensis]|uniref:DNA-directed RNA polymerase subunit beta' n=1 Tax=Akkermansia massiliensis TaxID=2927224 RepID=UPI001C061164|nr:DNA-directed RNA polymerase subunit beta' [Akkermansia massiliensis]QWP74154.1 DNA-directed RNA polymerase subunit beta' [Akkermansia massiliensis]